MDRVILKYSDTVKSDKGDDNLSLLMSIDTDDNGHYYKVSVRDTNTGYIHKSEIFRVDKEYMENPEDSPAKKLADEEYDRTYKEF